MDRPIVSRHDRDLAALRADLAWIAVDIALIRVKRALARKYRSDQPRAPAGQPQGGRWVSDGAGGADPTATGSVGRDGPAGSRTDEAVTDDGSRVLSIRIRANRRSDWDEQHTVTAPDGTRTVFETSGLTQTIRDGGTGAILGRSTLTTAGPSPRRSSSRREASRASWHGGPHGPWRLRDRSSRCSPGRTAPTARPSSLRPRANTRRGTRITSGPSGSER